jgi:hypothetical protein
VTEVESSNFLHIGLLEQRLKRLEEQLLQLDFEVESIEALSESSRPLEPSSIDELQHSLRAEILRLGDKINQCEADLLYRRAQFSLEAEPTKTEPHVS